MIDNSDQRIHVASAAVLIATVFYAFGLGLSSIFVVIGCLLAGIGFAQWMFQASDGEMLHGWKEIFRFSSTDSSRSSTVTESDERMDTDKTRQMPWQGLTLPSSLNDSIESLLNEIVEQYINGWYGGAISRDKAFLNEIRYQLRYASANLIRCIQKLDLSDFVATRALPISMFHVSRLNEMKRKIQEESEVASPRSVIETKIAGMLEDCHVTMSSRESETEYLKQVVDFLIPRLIDETRLAGKAHDDDSPLRVFGRSKNERPWPSKSVRSFMREMLTNAVLLPIFDTLTQPDTLNYWLVLLFNDGGSQIVENVDDTEVPLLKGLTEDATVDNRPDSLLQLKLSEVLRDARLYSIFRMYLQDIRGPVHELQFLMETTRIHESIQRKSESSSQIGYDIWQLYTQFIHESAQEQVKLDESLIEQFKSAVEANDSEILEGIVETSYQVVYNRMQGDHVVSFCQSECFLGNLCGSPPVTINELIDRDTAEKRKNTPVERTFSISQLRARVRKALTSIGDEEEEMESEGMPMTDVITINKDVSSPESQVSSASSFGNVPSIDVISVGEAEEPISNLDRLEKNNETGGLVMDPEPMDLNCWRVNVASVSTLRDKYTDRATFMFVIELERPDAKPHETRRWSIHRSFNEFYVLESKLNEFHGDSLRFSALPTRKTFVTKDKPFMEQHRLIFSTFLTTLSKQKLLNRSELLLAFLSSNEEFKDTLNLSDLNPWKVVKKMPGKLGREKGQNLKPFLLKSLAMTLAPVDRIEDVCEMNREGSTESETGNYSPATNAIYSSIYGNNFEGVINKEKARSNAIDHGNELWTRSSYDSILMLFWKPLKSQYTWVLHFLSAVRSLCNNTIDSAIRSIFATLFKKSLCTENLVYLVQHIQWTLFCNDQPWPTDQEMKMREELAKRRTLEYFQNNIHSQAERFIGREKVKALVTTLLDALQYPRLNKQLLYVLLDSLLLDVFPELSEYGQHPLL